MIFTKKTLDPAIVEQLRLYVRDIIGHIFTVYKELPCRYPEYIYQEALEITLTENGVPHQKESVFHPLFKGKRLESYFKMDFLVERKSGNVIIECKAVDDLGDRERHQLFSYLAGTEFPIGILVNFSTYPKAQIEKYYFDRRDSTITAF